VAFLQTLSDGFTKPYPDINTFTGMCTTCNPATDLNCSPSRQGNGFLIRRRRASTCASAICGVAPLPGPKLFRDKCRWAHAHLNSLRPLARRLANAGCERTSRSRRWRW